MKVFISYETRDGKAYAGQARKLFANQHQAWMYEHSKTPGAPTWREIANRILDSDLLFYICTPRSANSHGQGLEVGYALNNRVKVIAVSIDGARVPSELTAHNREQWPSTQFMERCAAFTRDLPRILPAIQELDKSIQPTREQSPTLQRQRRIRELNGRIARLDPKRIEEGRREILRSYLDATVARQVARIAQEPPTDSSGFSTIGLWEMRSLNDFNSPSYWWGPYFSDLGRALAAGEQNHLQEVIKQQIGPNKATISRSQPDFRFLEESIGALKSSGLEPDTLLAPIEVYVPFIKFFAPRMDWNARPERLTVGTSQVSIFWSHRYAPSASFIVFCRKAGIWHVIPDKETGGAIGIGLGESALYSDMIEIGAETTVRYEITQPGAFSAIGLSV